MAESQRQKRSPQHKVDTVDEEAMKKRDRMTLIMFGVIAVLVVIGMWALSKFLSNS